MTRKEIQESISANEEAIKALREIIGELLIKDLLLCDETQWFTEKREVFDRKEGRKTLHDIVLVGRIHWNEDFKDLDTGETITIERSKVVRRNGRWDSSIRQTL